MAYKLVKNCLHKCSQILVLCFIQTHFRQKTTGRDESYLCEYFTTTLIIFTSLTSVCWLDPVILDKGFFLFSIRFKILMSKFFFIVSKFCDSVSKPNSNYWKFLFPLLHSCSLFIQQLLDSPCFEKGDRLIRMLWWSSSQLTHLQKVLGSTLTSPMRSCHPNLSVAITPRSIKAIQLGV